MTTTVRVRSFLKLCKYAEKVKMNLLGIDLSLTSVLYKIWAWTGWKMHYFFPNKHFAILCTAFSTSQPSSQTGCRWRISSRQSSDPLEETNTKSGRSCRFLWPKVTLGQRNICLPSSHDITFFLHLSRAFYQKKKILYVKQVYFFNHLW